MQSQFLTPIRAEKLTGKWWQLTDRLVYYSAMFNATICAPAGFVTDFASVPRLPIMYWLFGGKADGPAGIHDLLYRWPFMSRRTADKVFLEAMETKGKSLFTRWPMYAGVRAGGWLSYKNMPGSLDYRMCKKCVRPNCDGCENYYADWQKCFKPGFWSDLGENGTSNNHYKQQLTNGGFYVEKSFEIAERTKHLCRSCWGAGRNNDLSDW